MQLEEGEEESAWNSPQPPHRDWVPAQNKLSGPLGALLETEESLWLSLSPLLIDNKNGGKQLQSLYFTEEMAS